MAAAGAFHADSAELAAFAFGVIGRKLVHVKIEISGNEQIRVAVAVVIRPSRSHAVAADAHAGLFGHVLKFAVSQVAIQKVATIAGDVDVLPAIVVKIHHGNRHAPAFPRQSRLFGNVGEMKVRVLVEQADHGIAAILVIVVHVGATDHQNVEFAVVVAINKTNTSAGGLDDVTLFGSSDMGGGQSRLHAKVFKLGSG